MDPSVNKPDSSSLGLIAVVLIMKVLLRWALGSLLLAETSRCGAAACSCLSQSGENPKDASVRVLESCCAGGYLAGLAGGMSGSASLQLHAAPGKRKEKLGEGRFSHRPTHRSPPSLVGGTRMCSAWISSPPDSPVSIK